MEKYFLPCAYKTIFGIDCPICGFQRSLLLLLRGDIMASLKSYPPLIPILLLMILFILHLIKPAMISRKFTLRYGAVVLTIIMLNYTVKMLL